MKYHEQKHIVVSEETKNKMDKCKLHPRETYEDVVIRLLNFIQSEGGKK